MRVHLLALPHTETTEAFSWCAYTQKVRKLADMLTDVGHEVYLYAGEVDESRAIHIPIVDRAWQQRFFGKYDWSRDVFNEFDPESPHWREFNALAVGAIRDRMQPGDMLGISMGLSQKPVADALPLMAVEMGIGYSGVFAPFRVFESYAWAHHIAGLLHKDDARFFDAVIPNAIEPESFPLGTGGEYHLFMGRFIPRKGPQIAAEATARLGVRLVMAGQGVIQGSPGHYQGIEGLLIEGDHISHVGVVGPRQRAELLGGAAAVWVPTQYLEPFGGVAVEAMACGTPVITTDWGAFTETVQQGVTGFRCNTLAQFVAAGQLVGNLDRSAIRDYALSRYSTDVVKHQYDAYLHRLATLHGAGWYA